MQKKKKYDLNKLNLSLTNDALFKLFFMNPDNLCVFLTLVLGYEVYSEDISYLPNEIIVSPRGKKVRLDLKISILNSLNIDIEMQNTKENNFFERAFHYLASIVMRRNKEGEDYNNKEEFICIWLINTDEPVFDNNSYYEIYSMCGEVSNERKNRYKIYFIDLKKLHLCDNIVLKEYLSMIESKENIIENLDSSNELIKKEAKKMNDYLNSNESFTLALETLKSELDYKSAIKNAKEEGIEQGIEKNKKEVILNLYHMGLNLESIAKAVNLSIDEVKRILESK